MHFIEGTVKNARHSNYAKTIGSEKERRTIDVHKAIFEIQNTSLLLEREHKPIPIDNDHKLRIMHKDGNVVWYNNLSNRRHHLPSPLVSLMVCIVGAAATIFSLFPMPFKWPVIASGDTTIPVVWVVRAALALITLITYFSFKGDRRKLRLLTHGANDE